MSLSVLIVTPRMSFGEYIRQILEEKYDSHIVVVQNVLGALDAFKKENFTHAFLDIDLPSGTVLELGIALRKIDPGLHLTLLSADPTPPPYDALDPWTLLRKPFYLPDLLRIFDGDLDISVDLPPANIDMSDPQPNHLLDQRSNEAENINWLDDVSKAAQHLTRLTLESSAQAALIIRERSLWAYSGQLSQSAAAELVRSVSNDKKTGDLLKFIRLETTQAEHMLYATELAKGINLAMVFDAETPFSTIRSQATHLADALSFSPPASEKAPDTAPEEVDEFEKEREELHALFDFGEDDVKNLPPITQILENIPRPNPESATSEEKASVPRSTPSAERSSSSLSNEPMPNPFGRTRASASGAPSVNFARESSPAVRLDDTVETDVAVEETRPQTPQRSDDELGETRVSKAAQRPQHPTPVNNVDLAATRASKATHNPNDIDLAATRASTPYSRPRYADLAATRASKPKGQLESASKNEPNTGRPHSITEVAGRVLAEPGTSGLYDLTYACLLLPRFKSHHLAGDLAERISEWMPSISVAFGWRLEYISVRPDYLQWVINVPPTASPGYLMRIIRKQTSERIFEEFPRLKRENPSGDFWAPGYLIMGGSQPHPSQLVMDYIQRTRERQGML